MVGAALPKCGIGLGLGRAHRSVYGVFSISSWLHVTPRFLSTVILTEQELAKKTHPKCVKQRRTCVRMIQLLKLSGQSHLWLWDTGHKPKNRHIGDIFSRCVFAGHQDKLVFTVQKIQGQMCPTPPRQVVWVRIMSLGGHLHLYLALSTHDLIVQDTFQKSEVNRV